MHRRVKIASHLVYFLIIAAVAVAGASQMKLSWDGLPYMAIVLTWAGQGPAQAHAEVYAQAARVLPEETYQAYIHGSPAGGEATYRQAVHDDPALFAQQLAFYETRLLYLASLYALHRLGVPLPEAMLLVSAGAYVFIAGLLWLWLNRHLRWPYGPLLALLLALAPPLMMVAKATTPDALSAALLLAGFYVLLERRSVYGFAAVMLAAIAVRHDNVFLVLFALAYLAWRPLPGRASARLPAAACALAAVALTVAIVGLSDPYGWSTLFQHTFKGFLPNPADVIPSVSWRDYARAAVTGLRSVFSSSLIPFAICGVLAYVLRGAGRRDWDRLYEGLLLVLVANIAVRYALFPVISDRFLVAHYLLAVTLLAIKSGHTEWVAKAPALDPARVAAGDAPPAPVGSPAARTSALRR